MTDDFDRAKELYEWNRLMFVFMGVSPRKSLRTFTVWMIYITIHMGLVFFDLYYVIGNWEPMIINIEETLLLTMIIIKMFVIKFSRKFEKITIQIVNSIDANVFDNVEEQKIYLNYNRVAKTYFRAWLVLAITAATMYHTRTLEFRIRAVLGNDSMPFVLPYRSRFFFEVNDSMTFWLVFIYESPMICVHMFHTMGVLYLYALILHVCGILSVLAFRIRNVGACNDVQSCVITFRDIVKRHRSVVTIAKDIDKVFRLTLLEELLISTITLGLAAYTALVNSDDGNMSSLFTFVMYELTIMVLIYGYCLAGEYLVTESTNVYEAFYQCQWYNSSDSFRKQLIICMIGASKPVQLTAGGFYIFCTASFTGILKTAFGYVSMLRTVM